MTPRLTLFSATLVLDSALSVSGLDRDSTSDRPFSIVDGEPLLVGRGLKGAAVAMARRFFDPLPRSVSESRQGSGFRRSAWQFENARPSSFSGLALQAGVGIRHKTGARATGVLHDREVVPAGTRWPLVLSVDWSLAPGEAEEAEGILGYVLSQHWSDGRCWLGGGASRGLGWCHIEDVKAFRLDPSQYERWMSSKRADISAALVGVPSVLPTRGWSFRTLDIELKFGEYRPEGSKNCWGLDMLAIGPHDVDGATQRKGSGVWAAPSWVARSSAVFDAITTDRPIVMDGDAPLLPGSSVRGPMRHAFSRAKRRAGNDVIDPHTVQGDVPPLDLGGQVFGSTSQSSRVLVRDGRAIGEWFAARLHMHAEDEFSAGSYGSAKRDAVRLLGASFPIRIVVEGDDGDAVRPLVDEVDRLVALGRLNHLAIGGHKTKGAGYGRWVPGDWQRCDVTALRRWEPHHAAATAPSTPAPRRAASAKESTWERWRPIQPEFEYLRVTSGVLDDASPTVSTTATVAKSAFGKRSPLCWWCDPAIDLQVDSPPQTFGRDWPQQSGLRVDEVAFCSADVVWRAVRTSAGARWVMIEVVNSATPDAIKATVRRTPTFLHDSSRFSAARTGRDGLVIREWLVDDETLGFTVEKVGR